MGMSMMGSSSMCGCKQETVVKVVEKEVIVEEPNPDPRHFEVMMVKIEGDYAIVSVRYPNCTNYEGNKLLVFEGVTEAEIRSWTFIDPHFCEGDHPTPIARFEPTVKGWGLAGAMCQGIAAL